MNPQNEKLNQKIQQNNDTSNAVYSIVTCNRTPKVNPGEKLEIEIFLSGYGIPEKNKLSIKWSSPYVIDKKNPGFFSYCIAAA